MSVSALHGSATAASGPTTGEGDDVPGGNPRDAAAVARLEAGALARPESDRDEVDVSVLVPAKDEAENLPLFMEQAREAFAGSPLRYEVVVVDDGSDDDTWTVLQDLRERHPFLRLARHRKRRGIADALRTGYLASRGRVLVFYPADLQYRPEDIPRLVAPIIAGESDMVTGHKQGVYEKAFVSRIYNRLSRTLFDVPVRDLNS
ncbi:MAG TPA: glycosyltransferase family 2 protein, partial [Gemmatimonadaceae bacterium]|nr:glycosyltransferase family 2 protein [Gemmatimonadaceae bacterium]